MNILFASSEVAPFIKTGGLADVAGSLPQALARMGHDVRVILPLYERVGQEWRDQMTYLQNYNVHLAWRTPYCGLFELQKDGVTYYFIDNEYYFKRWDVYGHFDDAERYAFFSRAVIETPGHVGFWPDVIHCNDWQTALVPIYLLEERTRVPELQNAKSVFTIHNIEYQGRYGRDLLVDLFGLSNSYFNEGMLAYYGDINLMKGAIYASDYVTTVSPTYAEELRYDFYAHGLAGVVAGNAHKIRGILNGIDVERYDPSHDSRLVKTFTAKQLKGKKDCKAALQEMAGLEQDPNAPVIGCVSRLVGHKGFDLVVDAIHDNAAWQYPGRFSAQIMYSDAFSNAIYSGADLFLMPSVAEPCGLSQMIAMRYGTLPVVRETGGLRDSVQPWNEFTGEGTGFTFANIEKGDMMWVLSQAVDLYRNDPKAWKTLQQNAMTADFSWDHSAGQYAEVYGWVTGK